jgi:hypothetical protein
MERAHHPSYYESHTRRLRQQVERDGSAWRLRAREIRLAATAAYAGCLGAASVPLMPGRPGYDPDPSVLFRIPDIAVAAIIASVLLGALIARRWLLLVPILVLFCVAPVAARHLPRNYDLIDAWLGITAVAFAEVTAIAIGLLLHVMYRELIEKDN